MIFVVQHMLESRGTWGIENQVSRLKSSTNRGQRIPSPVKGEGICRSRFALGFQVARLVAADAG